MFTRDEFHDWRTTLESKKDFARHETSRDHISALLDWKEHSIRQNHMSEVEELISLVQLDRNRYYIGSIFDVIKFLVLNELSLRGSSKDAHLDNLDSGYSNEKFLSLLSYSIEKDPKLKDVRKTIPDYAKYTSPEIQNNIIEDMATVVKKQIALMTKNSDCNLFTLKCDGTRDNKNVEKFSIVLRFVYEGKVHELDMTELKHDELDDKSMNTKIIEIFAQYGLDPTSLVSQCYDSARVISGKRGGVQKLLQDIIYEEIPFVHCFNHLIYLVITNALKRDDDIRRFLTCLVRCIISHVVRKFHNTTMVRTKLKRCLEQSGRVIWQRSVQSKTHIKTYFIYSGL